MSDNVDVVDTGTGTQSRDWVFVINSPVQSDAELYTYLSALVNVKYFCFCREKGNGTDSNPDGIIHHQGYIEFSRPKRFSTMKKYFSADSIGVNGHIDNRHGKRSECRDYVFKVKKYAYKADTHIGEVQEFGDFVHDGQRSDLSDIMEDIENGMTNRELAKTHGNSYVKNYKWADRFRQECLEDKYRNERRLDLEVIYIHGSTGCGKTRYVLDTYGDGNVFRMTRYGNRVSEEKFDAYRAENVIVFEEFRSSIKMSSMLNYIDVYPCQLPARMYDRTACYTKVFIISNWSLIEQYKEIQEKHISSWNAFLRRIHKVYDFDISKTKPIIDCANLPENRITHADVKLYYDKILTKVSDSDAAELPF